MTFQVGHAGNAGKVTTARALLWDEVQAIKAVVAKNPRDRAILSLGLGTGLRAVDQCNLKWTDLLDDGERMTALIREQKTGKLKRIVLNPGVSADLRVWRELSNCDYVLSGQRGRLNIGSLARLIKHWATLAGVDTTNVATHSIRKARCRALVEQFNEPLYKVMLDLNHSNERITAKYIGITQPEMQKLYDHQI